MTNQRDLGAILVTGATGKQGGATARALLSKGHSVQALVRDPAAPGALALKRLGATLVTGDLDDPISLKAACVDVHGVFSVQNPDFEDLEGDRERVRGRNLIEAARQAGVTHFVQTSTTGAGDHYRAAVDWHARHGHQNSLVSKGYVEDLVRDAGFAYWTILAPTFFMENIPFIRFGDRLVSAYDPARLLPIVTVDDIGAAAAAAFEDRERFNQARVELAGDLLTMPQIAAVLSQVWGQAITAPALTPAQVIAEGMMRQMVDGQVWHNDVGLPARPEVARSWGLATTSLERWAQDHQKAQAHG